MKMNMIMDYEFAKENFLLLLEHIEAYDFKYLTYQEIENETGIDSNIVKNYVIDPLVKERKIELKKEVIANRWAYSYRLLKERPVAIESQSINDNKLMVIDERVVLNKEFRIYGTKENPLFLAKDVAEWIDNKNVSQMLNAVDEEEKGIYNIYTLGGNQNSWFLTEDGLYEVLMQSRKPIAKAFKKEVKKILKQIRQTGGYIPVKQDDSEVEVLAKAFNIINKTNIMLENEVKALKGKLDGRDKSVTLTDGVKLLGIKGLNSTIFNKTMADLGYGSYEKRLDKFGKAKRQFKPNAVFHRTFSANGDCITRKRGESEVINYTTYMFEMISQNEEIMGALKEMAGVV